MSSLEKRYNELTLPPLLGGSHDNFSAPFLLPLLVHFLGMRSSPVRPRAGVRFRRLNTGAVLPLSSVAQIPFFADYLSRVLDDVFHSFQDPVQDHMLDIVVPSL